jgi:hypothetical protein
MADVAAHCGVEDISVASMGDGFDLITGERLACSDFAPIIGE